MPTLQQLRYLVAVADTLSFSRAATACHVTQPTLSLQLKELEGKLNTQLVERTRARVLLTSAGKDIAQRARRVLADIDDIREVARHDDLNVLKGTLQMGVVQTVGAYVLSVAMPSLRKTYPDLRIFVREDRLENLPSKLSEGAHDLLLLPEGMPSDHRLAQLQTVQPEDIGGETILVMERGRRLHEEISALCSEFGATMAQDFAGTTLDTLRLMVTTGMGLSLLPALYVRSDVLRETLVVARPLAKRAPARDVTIAWRSSSPRSAAYQKFAKIIAETLLPWSEHQ
jgi:LysR family hydrogen peroxide-inducible transcriptional activator